MHFACQERNREMVDTQRRVGAQFGRKKRADDSPLTGLIIVCPKTALWERHPDKFRKLACCLEKRRPSRLRPLRRRVRISVREGISGALKTLPRG